MGRLAGLPLRTPRDRRIRLFKRISYPGGAAMKWTGKALVAVLAILAISFVYSGLKSRELSGRVKAQRLRSCSEQKLYDCGLIKRYHAECSDKSYRSHLKIREFHPAEYDWCLESKIKLRGVS
jgi:hypothetical protein